MPSPKSAVWLLLAVCALFSCVVYGQEKATIVGK